MTMYSFFRALGALCASLDVGEWKGNNRHDRTLTDLSVATRLTGVAIQALIVYTGKPFHSLPHGSLN